MTTSRLAIILVLLGGSFACSPKEETACPRDERRCEGRCVDPEGDPAHCGGCGVACGVGRACVEGSCVDPCPEGLSRCGADCVDPLEDPAHCGGCGQACAEGLACSRGQCAACGLEAILCEGRCVDPAGDPAHCGGCGSACGAGEACEAGSCTCAPGFTRCGERCVDLKGDPDHCGDCETACPDGRGCSKGLCACPAGESACGDRCVDLEADPANCGTCDEACDEGKICAAGTCACPEGREACGGACVDLASDKAHCGGCGAACPAGDERGGYACEDRACTLRCEAGWADCEGTGRCDIALDFNASHCGQCGAACGGGKICLAGGCHCPAGTVECEGNCVDTEADPVHCGGCGVACAEGQGCSNGLCCDAGETGCGLSCVDLQVDPAHCGGCGNTCLGRPNASGGSCDDGACVLACEGGHLDCNERPADGCEIDGDTDPDHCGGCDRACPLRACVEGSCAQVTALGGSYSICAVRSDGTLHCWGDPYGDKLGTDGQDATLPAPVLDPDRNDLPMEGVVQTGGGFSHNCALFQSGEVRCWGAMMMRGNIDVPGTGPAKVRDPTDPTGTLQGVVQIAGNYQHTCARKADGALFCWGINHRGQIGAGHSNPLIHAVAVIAPEGEEGLLTGTLDVSVGEAHSCAIRADRTVVCWGYGQKGQLGRAFASDPKESHVPLPVLDPDGPGGLLSGAVQLALGEYHSCALLTDGKVKCWGQNIYRELGNGQSGDSAVPTLVSGLSGVEQIAANNNHVCARLGDGTAKCWGYAGSGAIGDGSSQGTVGLPSFVRDPADPTEPLRGIRLLGVAAFNSCAATEDDLFCWGTAPVGDGTTSQRELPTRVLW